MGILGVMVFGLIAANIIVLMSSKIFPDIKPSSYLIDWIFIILY